jgi:hypothetical protein
MDTHSSRKNNGFFVLFCLTFFAFVKISDMVHEHMFFFDSVHRNDASSDRNYQHGS